MTEMKRCLILFILFSAFLFSGCSGVSNTEPLFVYGIGVDAGDMGLAVHFLTGKGDSEKKGSSDGSNSKSSSGSEGSEESTQKPFEIYTFAGANLERIFDTFFENFKDVYTASTKIYALSDSLTEEQIYSFEIFLANSNKLPVKKEIVIMAQPYNYLETNAESLME